MQKKDRKFDEIYDVFALRVIVNNIPDCYRVLGIIHSLWKPKASRFKDYIAVSKPNGYRSLHTTVFGPEGKATEFQIRTKEMNDEALYGISAHWYYKQKSGSNYEDDHKQPKWVKEILRIQREAANSQDFVKRVKFDVFANRIFIFTPKGDVFDLPEGSTPVDLAYAVHTDVGHFATSALVNDKIAALNQSLKNGDLVEIITDKKRKGPNRDWLKSVKTQRAREKINHATKASSFEAIRNLLPRIG